MKAIYTTALVKEVSYDGMTGAVSLQLNRHEDQR
jgi:hypothetical protein